MREPDNLNQFVAAVGVPVTGVEILDRGFHDLLRVTFANGWTASIFKETPVLGETEPLYELAVIDCNGSLNYHNPLTTDVLRYQTYEEILLSMRIMSTWSDTFDGDDNAD